MQIEFTHIVGFIAIISTIFSIVAMLKKDNRTDGITQGKLSNDLEYVKRGVDNIALEQKDVTREISRLREANILHATQINNAIDLGEKAYKHATEAHSRINKLTRNKNEE